ncbi:hypothetical protein Pla52n_54250 [Stieleria varia]|uniref:Uncharacterized protein n=2 Tax=Stieleria varia TaxID=2528005 RepID=A0A5C6A3Y1_9BACT|nr:hypothetical protein Pla52n_54250 [Stieleria varia]
MFLVLCAVVFLVLCAGELAAQLPTTQLKSLSRVFLTVGSEADMSIASSADGDEITALRFSHPGITAELLIDAALPFDDSVQPRYGHFHVRVANDVPAGRYDVWAVGRLGVSNPRTISVHPEPTDLLSPSHDVAAPTELPLEKILQANASIAQRDFYHIHVDENQDLSIDLIAQQVDSRMIATAELRDADGRLLSVLTGSDHVDLTIPLPVGLAADYLLFVHDVLYRGGNEYPYGLVLHASDAVERASTHRSDERLVRSISAGAVEASQPADERSDDMESPRELAIPGTATARFDSASDVDYFQCQLTKGQSVAIEVLSERLGQPTDARLTLHRRSTDADGVVSWQQVAAGDDSFNLSDGPMSFKSTDPVINYTADVEATYRIKVQDMDSGEMLGKTQSYTLSVTPLSPSLKLLAYLPYDHRDINVTRPSGVRVLRGGLQPLRVVALRQNWSGPIELNVSGLPAGVHCAPVTMPAEHSVAQLNLRADEDAAASVAAIEVNAKASIGDQAFSIVATPTTVQWEKDAQRNSLRTRLVSQLLVSVSDLDVEPITIGMDDPMPIVVNKGDKAKLAVKLTRRAGGEKTPVILRGRDVPAGVTARDVTIAADQDTGEYTLDVTANAKPGTYRIWLQGETKVKFAPNPQSLQRATQYRDRLQKMRDDPNLSDQHKDLDAAIQTANKRVESAKPQANPRDFTIFPASPMVVLQVN